MKKKHQETVHSVSRSLFAFLIVAAVLAVMAIAPLINRSSAQNVASPSTAAATSAARTDDTKRADDTKRGDPKLVYPESKKGEQVDDYFGTKVPDPYRWLEDETSADTKNWVEAQNALTFSYLDRIPYREKLKARLTQ